MQLTCIVETLYMHIYIYNYQIVKNPKWKHWKLEVETHLSSSSGSSGSAPCWSLAGHQGENGQLLALHPPRLQTVVPLLNDSRLRVRVVRDPAGPHNNTHRLGHSRKWPITSQEVESEQQDMESQAVSPFRVCVLGSLQLEVSDVIALHRVNSCYHLHSLCGNSYIQIVIETWRRLSSRK